MSPSYEALLLYELSLHFGEHGFSILVHHVKKKSKKKLHVKEKVDSYQYKDKEIKHIEF